MENKKNYQKLMGIFLKRKLDPIAKTRGLSAFAIEFGISRPVLDRIVHRRRKINYTLALQIKFAAAFADGSLSRMWEIVENGMSDPDQNKNK